MKTLLIPATILWIACLTACAAPIAPTKPTPLREATLTAPADSRTAVYTLQMQTPANTSEASSTEASFTLSSPEVTDDGILPTEYTCDGASSTLPLTWSGAPAGTQSYAIIMHHTASPEDVHWYWVLYGIPAEVTQLSKNSVGIGTLGANSVNRKNEYTPPCSKGPGPKVYTYTVYALSAQPQLAVPASQVNREVLLEAIQNITLASAELNVTYSRK